MLPFLALPFFTGRPASADVPGQLMGHSPSQHINLLNMLLQDWLLTTALAFSCQALMEPWGGWSGETDFSQNPAGPEPSREHDMTPWEPGSLQQPVSFPLSFHPQDLTSRQIVLLI